MEKSDAPYGQSPSSISKRHCLHKPVLHNYFLCLNDLRRSFSGYHEGYCLTIFLHFHWINVRDPQGYGVLNNKDTVLSPACAHHGWILIKGHPVSEDGQWYTGQNAHICGNCYCFRTAFHPVSNRINCIMIDLKRFTVKSPI